MTKINLGEWTLKQASSGAPVTFENGETVYFEIKPDGIVNARNSELREQGNRVATREWVNNSIYTDGSLNADTVDGKHDSDFASSGHSHALGDLSDVSATGEGHSNGLNADTVDGKHDSDFASSGHSHALGDLSDVSASGEGHGKGLNSDTVDGQHASELGSTRSVEYHDTVNATGSQFEFTGLSDYDEIILYYENLSHSADSHYAEDIRFTVDNQTGNNSYKMSNFGDGSYQTDTGQMAMFHNNHSLTGKMVIMNRSRVAGRWQFVNAWGQSGGMEHWYNEDVNGPINSFQTFMGYSEYSFDGGTLTVYGVNYT